MNQRERMLSGLPHKAWLDHLPEEREYCKKIIYEFNTLIPKSREQIPSLIKKIIRKNR